MIEEAVLAHVYTDWLNAPHGEKNEKVEKWGKVLNKSARQLFRELRQIQSCEKKTRADKGKRKNADIEDWTRKVWTIKLSPPGEKTVLSTVDALETAVKNAMIPEEGGEVPIGTYNRVAKELGLNKTSGRFSRFQARYANMVHQFDATSSKYLYIARKLPGGDRLLKLHHPKSHYYKNKPVPVDRERPWIYGCTDDYSGMADFEYVAARGEAAVDALSFLQNAWGKKENFNFRGLPRLLYLDNGPLKKAKPVQDFFKRLNICMIPSTPYVSRARGKIERPWRTIFLKFELVIFAEAQPDWQNFTITMSELNRRLMNFKIKYASWNHRYEKEKSREQMWWSSINERGGVIDVSPEALATVFQRHKRTVTGGYIQLNNKDYEVLGLDEGLVWVYEGVFDDRLVVEDQRTFKRYEVKTFKAIPFGKRLEVVKSNAEKLLEENRDKIKITKPLYGDIEPSNIKKIPVRQKEERMPEDLLKVPAVREETESEKPFFATPRERYEWLLERKFSGDELPEDEIVFMEEFEKTPLYKQLAASYQRLQAFNQKRAANEN